MYVQGRRSIEIRISKREPTNKSKEPYRAGVDREVFPA
jgi:hypothetical protein